MLLHAEVMLLHAEVMLLHAEVMPLQKVVLDHKKRCVKMHQKARQKDVTNVKTNNLCTLLVLKKLNNKRVIFIMYVIIFSKFRNFTP